METKLIKELKCLVLFQDKILFKDILEGFTAAHVCVLKCETDEEYLKQIQNFQPHFTIIEVDITKPQKPYSLIKKHRDLFKNAYPIFLVGNAADSDLILQGIEIGATDFFQRPLDFDLIATKIGKYFLCEELLKRELSYSKVPLIEREAEVELPMKIISINEKGLVLKSTHMVSKGAKLDLSNSSLKQLLGLEELIVTVIKTQQEGSDSEILYVDFPEDEIYWNAARKLILYLKRGKVTEAKPKS